MFAGRGKSSRQRHTRVFVAFSAVMAVSLGGVAVASACGIGGHSPLPISSKCPGSTTTTAAPTNGSLHQNIAWGRFNSNNNNFQGNNSTRGNRLAAWQRFLQRWAQQRCASTTSTTVTSGGDNGSTTTVPDVTTTTTAMPMPTTTEKATTTTVKATTTTTVKPTTTTIAPVSNSNCTNPSFTTSDPEGTKNVDSNSTWWVNNDAWSGSHGPQSISVCSQSSWYAVSNQPDMQGQVQTYPDTEYDVGGRDNPSKKTIAQFNSINSTFSEQFPAQGSWDAAYDLWLNNWGTEIMIWNEWNGGPGYWPQQATTAVTLNGVPYHFLNNGGELMFFRDSQVKSGSVDILAAFKWLVSQNIVKSTDVPTQLEYGVEVCATNGNETFPVTGLTFSLS